MPDGTDDGVVEQYDITLDKRALDAYGQMYQAASKDGITLWISSGYRSPTLQAQLYQQEIDDNLAKGMTENEAVEEADRAVQKPGYSEHNTGSVSYTHLDVYKRQGMEIVPIYDDMTFSPASPKNERWVVVAKKMREETDRRGA